MLSKPVNFVHCQQLNFSWFYKSVSLYQFFSLGEAMIYHRHVQFIWYHDNSITLTKFQFPPPTKTINNQETIPKKIDTHDTNYIYIPLPNSEGGYICRAAAYSKRFGRLPFNPFWGWRYLRDDTIPWVIALPGRALAPQKLRV